MISFDNTEIAFKSKSDNKLQWAFLLFKLIDSNSLVKVGNFAARTALKVGLPVGWAVKPTIYKHFVGGESIDECKKAVENLSEFNVKAILDYSVEGTDDESSIQSTLAETLRSIQNAGEEPNIPFAVFKPTAFAHNTVLEKASAGQPLNEKEEKQLTNFKKHIDTLCKAAYDADVPLLIDAEDYAFQSIIDETVTEMMVKYNHKRAIVYNTLQMYRWDRLDFLKQEYQKAVDGNYYLGVKFVRGAYMEKERERAAKEGYKSPIQATKEDTDRDFNEALTFSVTHIDRVYLFCGTHNETSSQHLIQLLDEHQIGKNDPRIWFSQLYGMSDHISFNVAYEGYNVAKYVPYGPVKYVLPYLLRRVEENTSVAGQTGRELSLLIKEKKRRQQSQ